MFSPSLELTTLTGTDPKPTLISEKYLPHFRAAGWAMEGFTPK